MIQNHNEGIIQRSRRFIALNQVLSWDWEALHPSGVCERAAGRHVLGDGDGEPKRQEESGCIERSRSKDTFLMISTISSYASSAMSYFPLGGRSC